MEQKGIKLKSLTESIDTTTPQGKMFFQIAGVFAEFERNIIRERTKAELESARARGRLGGRPIKMTEEKIQMLKSLYNSKKISINLICDQLKISRSTLFSYMKKDKNLIN
jgi:DNA invertase Pin-like site-specific DNA recombinase